MSKKIPVPEIFAPDSAKNRKKSQKNSTFSSFKPNCSKSRTKDFESILRICSSNDTLSPQKIRMSRQIPVFEIFAPDSAENSKKSRKFEFFQDWWQILSKTAKMTLVIFLEIVVFLTFFHLKKAHARKDSGSWDISAGQCKRSQKS